MVEILVTFWFVSPTGFVAFICPTVLLCLITSFYYVAVANLVLNTLHCKYLEPSVATWLFVLLYGAWRPSMIRLFLQCDALLFFSRESTPYLLQKLGMLYARRANPSIKGRERSGVMAESKPYRSSSQLPAPRAGFFQGWIQIRTTADAFPRASCFGDCSVACPRICYRTGTFAALEKWRWSMGVYAGTFRV